MCIVGRSVLLPKYVIHHEGQYELSVECTLSRWKHCPLSHAFIYRFTNVVSSNSYIHYTLETSFVFFLSLQLVQGHNPCFHGSTLQEEEHRQKTALAQSHHDKCTFCTKHGKGDGVCVGGLSEFHIRKMNENGQSVTGQTTPIYRDHTVDTPTI